MTCKSKIILITGANRGIGYCIAQATAQSTSDVCILLASRKLESANEAIEQLKDAGVRSELRPVALDVTNDQSVRTCIQDIERDYERLDVLINNAGIAGVPSTDHTDLRATYNSIFNTNITSVGLLTSLALPLLRKSNDPRVINISSGRASMQNLTTGNLPPTASVPYSISKVALNVLTIEMAKAYPDIDFYAANPGHCKTAFNGYRGSKDPLDGAQVAMHLALAEKGQYKPGFWQCEGGVMGEVPW